MEKDNSKIITVSFVVAGFLTATVIRVLMESLAASWGPFARIYDQDWVQHGIPVAAGLILFFSLQLNKKVRVWADEVVVELRKVVWPSQRDTTAMTTVCCVMLLVSGAVLGVFDFLSRSLIKYILN